MKIVVMGGGVIGVTTAYYLARDGHEVTVLDRQSEAASETSFANAGLIAPGHAYAWSSPKAPKILFKSLIRGDQALRLRLRADPQMWSWMLLFLRQCTAERARLNTIRKLRLCIYSQEALHEVVEATSVTYDRRTGGSLYLYRTQASFDLGVANSAILRDRRLVAFARMGDRLRLTSTAEFSGYDRSHRPKDFRAMLRVAHELFPTGGDYAKPFYWAGLRPMTPEGTPIFGRTRYSNLILNTGHGHMGWTMACGSARITADLIAGRQPGLSLEGMTLQ